MRIMLSASMAALLLTTPALGASQKSWGDECADTRADPDRNIAACTLILNGIESPRDTRAGVHQSL